jgi:hypothetical protein
MGDADLHDRLEGLAQKIAAAQERIRMEHDLFHDTQHLTGQQLKDRYAVLKQKLKTDVADQETTGRHVTNLEKSVREWVAGLGIDI